MSAGQYIENAFFIVGCAVITVIIIISAWNLVIYVFLGGDDQERARSKKRILYSAITLMFVMIFWSIFAIIGRALLG